MTKSDVAALKSGGDGAAVEDFAEPAPSREFGELIGCGGAFGERVPRKARAKPDLADQIGLGLRTAYNDVLSQPVPDRFLDLLRQLETSGAPQAKKD
ncbi:NepR family anti-sigma factor [Methylocella sp.]|uniref:NepR family anti-sigma factor n=1 Tax=Methylocella sp. TaxID=1978226 RepID=UPI0037843EE7